MKRASVNHLKVQQVTSVQDSDECEVLFVLGTIVPFDDIPTVRLQSILNAFGDYTKCRFLVKFPLNLLAERGIKEVPSNVQIMDWIEQQTILGTFRLLIEHNFEIFAHFFGN